MPGAFIRTLAWGLLALAGACASGPQVQVAHDPAAAFESYRTFAFRDPLGTDVAQQATAASRHLKEATRREMEARGLRYEAATPDLLVDFNGKLGDAKGMAPDLYGPGYYGYRHGQYAPWAGYAPPPASYREGTLNVDIVDAAKKQLVWEATVSGIAVRATLEDLRAAIDEAVTAAFQQYPRKAP